MRLAVTGLSGQIVSALIARAPNNIEMVSLGRPQLDLAHRDAVLATMRAVHCDVIVNAAAYTAVDKAETEPEVAMKINGDGAGFVAQAAKELNIPLLHLSTDYVFDGLLDRPYREDDATNPLGAYGRSKFEGESQILETHSNSVILRTAWIYSPYGANFVKTMLHLAKTKNEIGVVSDQIGNPTYALDIADALFRISRQLMSDNASDLRGVFHITGGGEASWADLAEAVFLQAARMGRTHTKVRRITSNDYPTPATRPENSRLDNGKLNRHYGIILPDWRESINDCVDKLLSD